MSKLALPLLALLVLFPLGSVPTSGCGTCVGNPECVPGFNANAGIQGPTSEDFAGPIRHYQNAAPDVKDCGAFTEQSKLEDVEAGRSCIRTSLADCTLAKYLLNETTSRGYSFVSFVGVELTAEGATTCQLRVHTVSSDSARFLGDEEKTCASVGASDTLELACSVGQ
ncbi:MAG: hypothetical protein V1798_00380 [Pseudomonadota bacterium]